jgi:hypothetical protein
MNAMARAYDNDPALEKLHELTERIRRRAAEARERAMARERRLSAARPRALQLSLQLPLPRRPGAEGRSGPRSGKPSGPRLLRAG